MSSVRTKLCDDLGIQYPVILAGMGFVSTPELAAAVSNAGGLGVLGQSKLPEVRKLHPDELSARIRHMRELTDKPFGIDMLLPSNLPETEDGVLESIPQIYHDFAKRFLSEHGVSSLPSPDRPTPIASRAVASEMLDVIIEEKVKIFVSALGLPSWASAKLREADIRIMSLVGNVRSAKRVVEEGASVVIASGTEAGGHTGRVGTMSLVPQVVDAVGEVPVLAAGGISDGRGLAAALALGAQGVWVGTAFVATKESPVHQNYKQRIVDMGDDDTLITRYVSGKTVRVLPNELVEAWEQSGLPPLKYPQQHLLSGDMFVAATVTGNMELMPLPVGQGGGLIRDVRSAADTVLSIVQEAEEALDRLTN